MDFGFKRSFTRKLLKQTKPGKGQLIDGNETFKKAREMNERLRMMEKESVNSYTIVKAQEKADERFMDRMLDKFNNDDDDDGPSIA